MATMAGEPASRQRFTGREWSRSLPRGRTVFIGTSVLGIAFISYQITNSKLKPSPFPTHLIPLSAAPPPAATSLVANSPSEARLTPLSVIRYYVIEPLLTALRFLRLAFIFGPVILASPMLLVGSSGSGHVSKRFRRKQEDDENWGAVWWYSFLVKQMERAGPTFIKVRYQHIETDN